MCVSSLAAEALCVGRPASLGPGQRYWQLGLPPASFPRTSWRAIGCREPSCPLYPLLQLTSPAGDHCGRVGLVSDGMESRSRPSPVSRPLNGSQTIWSLLEQNPQRVNSPQFH